VRDLEQVPRALVLALAVLAAASFSVGSALEISGAGWLAAHPYWGNLLSGTTGFSSSGLTVSVIFRRMQIRQQRQTFLHSIRPELQRVAAQSIALAYRVLDEMGQYPSGREEQAFLSEDGSEEQVRAFKILSSAPRTKPLSVVAPTLLSAASSVADAFQIVEQAAGMTLRALANGRTLETSDYLIAMQATGSHDSWFWRDVRIDSEQREQIVRDVGAALVAVEASGVLEVSTTRDIADALTLARSRAEQFADDPEQDEAVSRALTTLTRITVGLPHTMLPSLRVNQLVDHCRTVAYRPLQLCADLLVAWALLLDVGHHPKLGNELRAALATLIPGADAPVAAPIPLAARISDLDELFFEPTPPSVSEQLIRAWYEQKSVGDTS
jgi:hypothetical protein